MRAPARLLSTYASARTTLKANAPNFDRKGELLVCVSKGGSIGYGQIRFFFQLYILTVESNVRAPALPLSTYASTRTTLKANAPNFDQKGELLVYVSKGEGHWVWLG